MEWLIVLLAMIVAVLAAMVLRLDYALRQMDDRLAHTHHVAHTALEMLSAHVSGVPIKIVQVPLRKDDIE